MDSDPWTFHREENQWRQTCSLCFQRKTNGQQGPDTSLQTTQLIEESYGSQWVTPKPLSETHTESQQTLQTEMFIFGHLHGLRYPKGKYNQNNCQSDSQTLASFKRNSAKCHKVANWIHLFKIKPYFPGSI